MPVGGGALRSQVARENGRKAGPFQEKESDPDEDEEGVDGDAPDLAGNPGRLLEDEPPLVDVVPYREPADIDAIVGEDGCPGSRLAWYCGRVRMNPVKAAPRKAIIPAKIPMSPPTTTVAAARSGALPPAGSATPWRGR